MKIEPIDDKLKKVILDTDKHPTPPNTLWECMDALSFDGTSIEEEPDYNMWRLSVDIPDKIIVTLCERLGYEI